MPRIATRVSRGPEAAVRGLVRLSLPAAVGAVALLLASPAGAQSRATRLTRLDLTPSGNGLIARIEADGPVEHRIYVIEDPMQVVLDVLDVRNPLKGLRPDSPHPLLLQVRSEEVSMTAYDSSARDRTFARLTFELKQAAWHSILEKPTGLELGIYSGQGAADVQAGAGNGGPTSGTAGTTAAGTSTISTESGSGSESGSASRSELENGVEGVERGSAADFDPATAYDAESDFDADPAATSSGAFDLSRFIEPADVSPDVFFGVEPTGPSYYQMGADDVVEINVFELEQLNRTVRVEADGSLILPLIGPVRVAGLSAPQAAEAIARQLRGEFVDDPQVTLRIVEFNSRRVSLLGAVARPGTYPLMGTSDLLELLAVAQGLADGAGSVLYLFRRLPDGRSARLSVPLHELLVFGEPRWNVRLKPGDTVSVPPEAAISISVVGAVGAPGVYKLPASNGATLLRAIALAGGLKERASKSIQVKRQSSSGEETIVKVDLDKILAGEEPDFTLREGDVVIVDRSFF